MSVLVYGGKTYIKKPGVLSSGSYSAKKGLSIICLETDHFFQHFFMMDGLIQKGMDDAALRAEGGLLHLWKVGLHLLDQFHRTGDDLSEFFRVL